jgi:hypothetical protein
MTLRLLTMLLAMLCIAPRIARAESEPIALLPLDADGRLEIYGQPVAAEIARALTDGKLTVVVVEAKMAIPDGTKLVVAGSITGKGTAVVLGVQVRNPADGTVTDKLEEPAANVAGIGKAAAKLAERLAPVVKARLEVLRKVVVPDRKPPPDVRPQVALPVILLGVGVSMNASLIVEPFRQALIDSVNRTLRANQRQPSPVDASTLGAQLAVQTVATARASRGIVFEILDYAIEPGMIPLVRARVRVRIADGTQVQFDEVLATDTIVGDKLSPPAVLAFRTAREIMTILRPHLRKLEPQWR